jgi:GAF domain-containing protein
MHATNEVSFATTVCNAATESGTYTLAWVGYVEHDSKETIRPIASSGSTEYLDDVHFSWGNDELGNGSTGRAIRTKSVSVMENIHVSRRCNPWRDRGDECAARTACSFPIVVDDDVMGALTVYSRDQESFVHDEIELLSEVADTLSLGIAHLRHADQSIRNEVRPR